MRAAGADFQIGHVDVGGERRIGIAEFAPDPVERGLHGQARVRAHDQEIHEIGKAGLMLKPLRRDPAVEIEARRQISAETASHDEKPERELCHAMPSIGRTKNDGECEADRHSRAGDEEIGRSVRIVDAGLHQPAAQHLHVLAVDRRIMLGGIVDELLRGLEPGIAQRTPAGGGSSSRPTRAARRRTASRARTPIITAKASVPAARKTRRLSIVAALSPNRPKLLFASIDQILKFTILNMIRLPISIQPAAQPSRTLVRCSCQTDGVEIRRHHLDDDEHADRQRRQDHRRGAAFGRQRANFSPHLETLADDAGKVLQDFAEIAAGRALDADGGDEQRQIVRADAAVEVAHRRFQIRSVGDLVGHHAELAADRIGHFAAHHVDGDRHRMAGAQAAHDDVERIGELGGEFLLPPAAQQAQHEIRQRCRAQTARPAPASTRLPRNRTVPANATTLVDRR